MTVVRVEDVYLELDAFRARAATYAERAEAAAHAAGKTIRRLPDRSKVNERIYAKIVDALEDEVVIARPAEESGQVIGRREEDLEIAKRALVGLKAPELRKIAEGLGLPRGGKMDALAERVAQAYKVDAARIAQLVIEHEAEPPPERRLSSRLFPLNRVLTGLGNAEGVLQGLVDRYIRVGTARWFIFEKVSASNTQLFLEGTFRHYLADAKLDDEIYELTADRRSERARLTMHVQSRFALVEAKGDGESRAIADGFAFAAGIERAAGIDYGSPRLEGPAFAWTPRTGFMLELLRTRFGSPRIALFNLTTAGFSAAGQSTVALVEEDSEVALRPAVKSVRFQGTQLLGSRAACELITAGQDLLELSMVIQWANDDATRALLPLSIKLARDHIYVGVGFGTQDPQVATAARDAVIQGIEGQLGAWPNDRGRLERLAQIIRDRARGEQPEDDDILDDPDII